MAKPEPVRPTVSAKPVIRTHVPATRPIVVRTGENKYDVVLETYDCAPTKSEVARRAVTRLEAEEEIRLRLETYLGPNRFGDSGL